MLKKPTEPVVYSQDIIDNWNGRISDVAHRDGDLDSFFFRAFGDDILLPSKRSLRVYLRQAKWMTRSQKDAFSKSYVFVCDKQRVRFDYLTGKRFLSAPQAVALFLRYGDSLWAKNDDIFASLNAPQQSDKTVTMLSMSMLTAYLPLNHHTVLDLENAPYHRAMLAPVAFAASRWEPDETVRSIIPIDAVWRFSLYQPTLKDQWLAFALALYTGPRARDINIDKWVFEISTERLSFDDCAPYFERGLFDPKSISNCQRNDLDPDIAVSLWQGA